MSDKVKKYESLEKNYRQQLNVLESELEEYKTQRKSEKKNPRLAKTPDRSMLTNRSNERSSLSMISGKQTLQKSKDFHTQKPSISSKQS